MRLKDLLQLVDYDKPIVLASMRFKDGEPKERYKNQDGSWNDIKEYLYWYVVGISTTVGGYLYIEIDNQDDDEIVHLKFERDTYKEKYKEWFQNFIKTKAELERVDRIVLQYEQRINLLDGEIEELKKYMEELKEYE